MDRLAVLCRRLKDLEIGRGVSVDVKVDGRFEVSDASRPACGRSEVLGENLTIFGDEPQRDRRLEHVGRS